MTTAMTSTTADLVAEYVPAEDRTAALAFVSAVVETIRPTLQPRTRREELARLTAQVLPAALIDEDVDFYTAAIKRAHTLPSAFLKSPNTLTPTRHSPPLS